MVEDEPEDDAEAGPELPPDFNPEEEDIPDDEEGRFFGGGVHQKTAQAMEYIDQHDEGEVAVCLPSCPTVPGPGVSNAHCRPA